MVSEPPGDGESLSPDSVDRLVRRLGKHRSLPAARASKVPALGPPSATADESRAESDAPVDIVATPSWVYVTVELPGASRETLEVTATNRRLTIHAVRTDGRVSHREVDLPGPVESGAVTATYRNGVLDVTIPRRTSHQIRVRRRQRHV